MEEIKEKLENGLWAYTIEDKKIILKYLGDKEDTVMGYSLEINLNK